MNEEIREKLRNGCTTHIEEVQQFFEDYVGSSFGIMPKGEIDV